MGERSGEGASFRQPGDPWGTHGFASHPCGWFAFVEDCRPISVGLRENLNMGFVPGQIGASHGHVAHGPLGDHPFGFELQGIVLILNPCRCPFFQPSVSDRTMIWFTGYSTISVTSPP